MYVTPEPLVSSILFAITIQHVFYLNDSVIPIESLAKVIALYRFDITHVAISQLFFIPVESCPWIKFIY